MTIPRLFSIHDMMQQVSLMRRLQQGSLLRPATPRLPPQIIFWLWHIQVKKIVQKNFLI